MINRYAAKFVSNHDGDTCTFHIDLGFGIILQNQNYRLYGINTAELNGEQKETADKAKLYVERVLRNAQYIEVQTHKTKSNKEKKSFDRYIATVYFKNSIEDEFICLNDILYKEKLAEIYKKIKASPLKAVTNE
jgi:endonuclease YncB( thermonuclease family)